MQPHGLWPARLLSLWNSLGKNAGVGYHALLQGIFPTQGSNPGLLHCRWILYWLGHQGSPCQLYLKKNSDLKQMYYIKLHIRSLMSHWAKIKVLARLRYFEALKGEPNSCLLYLSSAVFTSFNDCNHPVAQNWELWVSLPERCQFLYSSQFLLLIACRVTFYSLDQIVSVTCFKYINEFSHNWNKSQIPSVTYKALPTCLSSCGNTVTWFAIFNSIIITFFISKPSKLVVNFTLEISYVHNALP